MPAFRAPLVINSPLPTPPATGTIARFTVRPTTVTVPATVTPQKFSPVSGAVNGAIGALNYGAAKLTLIGTFFPVTTWGQFRFAKCQALDIGGMPNHTAWVLYVVRPITVTMPATVTPQKFSPVSGVVNGAIGALNYGRMATLLNARMYLTGAGARVLNPILNVSAVM